MQHRRLISLAAGLSVLGLLAVCCMTDCSHHATPGIEPTPDTGFFGRREQVRLPDEKADMAVIFVGGFTELMLTHLRSTYETMSPLPCEGRQLRAFYGWEGGTGSLLYHTTALLQRDLRAFIKRNPQAEIVLIGHSYGGSAIMDALRHLHDVNEHGHITAVTLDPVSRFKASAPRERAQIVDYWINTYCDPYCDIADVVPMVGGAWRHCPQADVNFNYLGTAYDSKGRRFQHRYPEPLLMERAPRQEASPYELLCRGCRERSADRTQP